MKTKLINENFRKDYINNLLHSRGIDNVELFLNPTSNCLNDWKTLDNISAGVDLVERIISKDGSKIGLVVDSDVDGFTSSAIIYLYLNKISNSKIIPKLHTGKQHGLEDMWEYFAYDEKCDLIICPDGASNDAEYAEKLDCPILIIDHHIVENEASHNMIVINNQISANYSNKNQSGAGIVYQFCRALDDRFGYELADNFIDLAAIGSIGDMMSALEYENQWLWKNGLNNLKNIFLKTLFEYQSYSMGDKLNPTTVAFYMVPLMNAMIRTGAQEEKERMFIALIDGERKVPSKKRGAKGELIEVAKESVRECVNAKAKQNRELENATDIIEQKISKYDLLSNQILFIRLDEDDKFPASLNGLLAMRCAAKYKRPTIVARLNDEGFIRGSARGVNDSELISFKNYLNSTSLFEYTMGHDNAFGCSIPSSYLNNLLEKSNEDLKQYNFNDSFYEVNFERRAAEMDIVNLIKDVATYENTYGQSNGEPLISITDLNCYGNEISVIGKNKDTLKIVKNGVTYIKFHAKDMIAEIVGKSDIKINLVGKANLNLFAGRETPQIFIENYEVKDGKLEF